MWVIFLSLRIKHNINRICINNAYEYERSSQISILGKEDIGKIWRGNSENKKVGEEGNDTATHGASKSEHVEWLMKNTN